MFQYVKVKYCESKWGRINMFKKIIGVVVSLVIGFLLANGLNNESMLIPGFIASLLTFIYFEMPDKK
jgi:4-hydroxybenzoate polyprenyltransferase